MFCKKCGSILKPVKENGKIVTICPRCGNRSVEKIELKEKINQKEEIKVVEEKNKSALPSVEITCPKCGHNKAFFWTMQTRAADEPETSFYKCEKCGHTWREY